MRSLSPSHQSHGRLLLLLRTAPVHRQALPRVTNLRLSPVLLLQLFLLPSLRLHPVPLPRLLLLPRLPLRPVLLLLDSHQLPLQALRVPSLHPAQVRSQALSLLQPLAEALVLSHRTAQVHAHRLPQALCPQRLLLLHPPLNLLVPQRVSLLTVPLQVL